MQSLGLILFATLAAMAYGVVHNLVSATLSPEHLAGFSRLSSLGPGADPTALAVNLGWRTTWFMGFLLGFQLVLVGRLGSRARLGVRTLAWGILGVVLATTLTTCLTASWTYLHPNLVAPTHAREWSTAACMHTTSYLGALLWGNLVSLGFLVYRWRQIWELAQS